MARIMIVDDSMFMRAVMKDIIVDIGHEVIGEAICGKHAIEMYPQLKPDLVTMDITMPDMDGFSAVALILKIDPLANIVMCSAQSQRKTKEDALSCGAKDYIVKPFNREEIMESFDQVLYVHYTD